MIKFIKFSNFRKFKNENSLDFFSNQKKEINTLIGVTGFSSSGKTTILSYLEFIPILWNLKLHYTQFIKTTVLTEILKEYKERNENFLNKYKTPILFQESNEYNQKYSQIIDSKESQKNFLNCNLFKLNICDKKIPLISETSYLLENNDYIVHKIKLDLVNNLVSEVFLLNGDEKLDFFETNVANFQSKIQNVLSKYNEKPIAFINLSNLSKDRISADEQNRRLFTVKIDPKHKKLFKSFINLFDPSIVKINYNENNLPITYEIDKNNVLISFNDLSTGTRKAIYLWSQLYVTMILNNRKFFFIYDEIQDNWNLALIDLIFYIFTNKKINSKHSQLLFSTHNPIIMENFSKDQIFLINENIINRVDQIKIKNDEKFSKAYLYDKLVKNNYKTWLDDFIKELSKIN